MNLQVSNPYLAVADVPFAKRIGRAAIQSLYRELTAYPKPGLVSLVDSGSHNDMDARTFVRSLFALRHYFWAITAAGQSVPSFTSLQTLGRVAEVRMLEATQGINTHRGAIFNLGLLAAAAGLLRVQQRPLAAKTLSETVQLYWGRAILDSGGSAPLSHGRLAAQRYGVGGARVEAAAGFPHLLQIGLPALQQTLARTGNSEAATVHCFFSLVAALPDTNLLYRAGREGLTFARRAAQWFLDEGGVERCGWQRQAIAIHQAFVRRHLSPGGSADLLAATLFVHQITSP